MPYPLYSGGQIRIYNLLKRLSSKYNITLVTFLREEKEREYIRHLSFCKRVEAVYRGRAWQARYVFNALTGSYPFVMATYDNPLMRQRIEQLLVEEKIDVIHIEPSYVYPSLPDIAVPLIVSEHNIEHTVYHGFAKSQKFTFLRGLYNRDVKKLKKWEETIWKRASHIVCVSEEDAQAMKKAGNSRITVVPNGIDETSFAFRPKDRIPEEFTALFVGYFRWFQNKDAVLFLLKELWPRIHRKFPKSRLHIVGREFPGSQRSLLDSSVTLKEEVEDIAAAFHDADLLLAPLRVGGGTKYKILEAMAVGLPVFTTEKGTQGLDIKNGFSCFVNSNTEDWIQNISRIISQPDLNKKITQNARNVINKQYTWSIIAKKQEVAWEKAYAGRFR